MAALFLQTTIDSMAPDYGSGSHIGQIGRVFIVGFGLIVLGGAVMLTMAIAKPEFFRRNVLGGSSGLHRQRRAKATR